MLSTINNQRPSRRGVLRFSPVLTGLLSAVLLAGFSLAGPTPASAQKVRTDYDRDVTFAQLRTYDWVDNSVGTNGDQPTISPLLERRIHNAVDSELASKGFQKVRSGAPDFRVAYRVVAEEKVTTDRSYGYSPFYGHHGFGHHGFGHRGFGHRGFGHGHFGHHGFGPYYGSSLVREYLETTLILDIFDARKNELVWRGWATADLARNPRPEKVRKFADTAVQKILKKFPPGS